MHDILIEAVKSDEVKLLVEISSNTFYDTFANENSKEDMELFLRENFNEESLTKELLLPGNYFFFARIENEIAGYLKLSENETPSELEGISALNISRIYVLKKNKGSGVGKVLMQFSISFAKKLNRPLVWLGVWERNFQAIGFYKKWGFEKFGTQLFLLGNDLQTDWLMKKELGDKTD